MIMPRTCNRQSKDFYQLLLTKIEFSYVLISISMILLGCSTSIIASNIYHEDFMEKVKRTEAIQFQSPHLKLTESNNT